MRQMLLRLLIHSSNMFALEGTVNVMRRWQLDLQRFLSNLYLINKVEDTVVSISLKVFNLNNFYVLLQYKCASYFCKETEIENNQFSKLYTLIYNSYLIKQRFKENQCESVNLWITRLESLIPLENCKLFRDCEGTNRSEFKYILRKSI